MKKVGIVTIIDYNNYGNRLQNYALQEVIKSLGCQPTTIINYPKNKNNGKKKGSIFQRFEGKSISDVTNKIISVINNKKNSRIIKEKRINLKKFSAKYINESNFIIFPDNIIDNLGNNFDYFIVGSDQVWNPNFRNLSQIDFLTFAPQGKKIAYAPSFGVSKIPQIYKEKYREWIKKIDHLSVREGAGAGIIKELTGREVEVLLDPTLMLSKDKWIAIAKPSPAKSKGKYLLTYFLGDISSEAQELINFLSRDKKLKIVHLCSFEQKERYSADPSEFIDFIDSASIFLTDSLHGAVFSILFEKPFIVFDRISKTPCMNSRIDTLLSKFELLERRWPDIKDNEKEISNIDYSHVPPILEAERRKSLDYLKEALNIEDGI